MIDNIFCTLLTYQWIAIQEIKIIITVTMNNKIICRIYEQNLYDATFNSSKYLPIDIFVPIILMYLLDQT